MVQNEKRRNGRKNPSGFGNERLAAPRYRRIGGERGQRGNIIIVTFGIYPDECLLIFVLIRMTNRSANCLII